MTTLRVSGSGAAAYACPIASQDVSEYPWVTVQLAGTWVATVAFECSVDGSAWYPVLLQNVQSASSNWTGTATANGAFHGPLRGQYFRCQNREYTSGTVEASATFSDSARDESLGGKITTATCTIINGKSLSDAANLAGMVPVGVLLPGTWDAAVITFRGSADNATFGNVYDSVGEVNYPAAASLWMSLNPAQFAGVQYLKVRSGTAASAVNQTTAGNRTITLILRSVQ